MAKNTKKATFIIDDKEVKLIEQYDKNNNLRWSKFKPTDKLPNDKSLHFISGNPEQNHFDLMVFGQETKKVYNSKIRPAGVMIYLGKTEKDTKYITLPPVEASKEELPNQSTKEKAEEYIRRVKLLNPNK